MRAYFNGLINRNIPHDIPFGTLGVNLIGSLMIGLLFALFTYTQWFNPTAKSFLSTGILGALTTYSTFALETFWLFQGGSVVLGLSNALLNLIGTIIAAGSGFKLGELFLR